MEGSAPKAWVLLIENLVRAIHNNIFSQESNNRRQHKATLMAGQKRKKTADKAIRDTPARPIQFLMGKDRTMHTRPLMIDLIMTEACTEMHWGTDRDRNHLTRLPSAVRPEVYKAQTATTTEQHRSTTTRSLLRQSHCVRSRCRWCHG